MTTPQNFFFTREHEWLAVEQDGKTAKVGISDYAQHKLGDITYVEPPALGKVLSQGEVLTTVESVKAASDIFMPVSGKVVEVNTSLDAAPEVMNKDPYAGGWIVKIEITESGELKNLMSAADYDAYIASLE